MMEPRSDRRTVLARIVSVGVGLIGAGLAGLVGLVAAPKAAGKTRQWRRVASSLDVPPDQPMTVVLSQREADGWYQTRKQSVVFVDRDAQGFRAFSATCTHLGCRVHWDDATSHYRCPCHGGVYDRDGLVVAGPPPRGLDRVGVRVNPQTSEIEVEL